MDPQEYRALVRQVAFEQAKLSTAAFFFTGEERLRLRTFGSLAGVVVTLELRLLDPAGRLQAGARDHTPNSDRTEATTLVDVGEGFLLNASLRASTGAPRRGQVFAILEVVRGLGTTVHPLACLLQDYVTDTSRIAWPGSPIRSSGEGPGVIRAIVGTDPAAGVEISETVPTNARWVLHSLFAQLVTSVTAATREAQLVIDDGANILYATGPHVTQIASLTHTYTFADANQRAGLGAGVNHPAPLPKLPLEDGFRIRTVTIALQAGDNWGPPQMLVEEWIED